ncbi:MAG: hypothetical protein AB1490_16965 [Pseudomonadota bacterium]
MSLSEQMPAPRLSDAAVLDDRSQRALRCASEIRELAEDFIRTRDADQFPVTAMQDIFNAAVMLYALMAEAGCDAPPLKATNDASATAAMIAATGMLKSVNVELFELGMWQAWSGTR